MKITKLQLNKIIKEELEKVLLEQNTNRHWRSDELKKVIDSGGWPKKPETVDDDTWYEAIDRCYDGSSEYCPRYLGFNPPKPKAVSDTPVETKPTPEPELKKKPKLRKKKKRKRRKKLRCKACFDWLVTQILTSRFLTRFTGGLLTTELLEGAILSGEVNNWIDEGDAQNLRIADRLRMIVDWGPNLRREYYDRYNSGEGTYTRKEFNKKEREWRLRSYGSRPGFDPEAHRFTR